MQLRAKIAQLFLTVGILASSVVQREIPGDPFTVGYSTRGILIDGHARILTSGAIHYPRSTPGMWDSLMKKAKKGGLNTIDTYVFWNIHEPIKGEYDFYTDRANLPLFLEIARNNRLFVILRIGPYVCAEWNFGGFPQWLRHESNIVFRTYSEPFMREMKRFITKVLQVVDSFMPENGGPIISMQIENEYGDYQHDFGKDGNRYAKWCGETAMGFNLSVPWIMCNQYYHVDGIIPTQNGFYSHQQLKRFHREYPDMPGMWTEMWPAWFQRWGEPKPYRPIEDIAYAVAKWFAYGGSYVSYYMYQGGTNFGRTSGPFITTSYDYDGFIDEYGLENWPKYIHLQQLHQILLENEQLLTKNNVPDPIHLVNDTSVDAYVYGKLDSHTYLVFLINSDNSRDITVKLDGIQIELPKWSVSIIRGGGNSQKYPEILYNTANLSEQVKCAQEHPAKFEKISTGLKTNKIYWRPLLTLGKRTIKRDRPAEQLSITDDRTDYLWYRTQLPVPTECLEGSNTEFVLNDAGDVAFVYFNGEFIGMQYGQHDKLSNFVFDIPRQVLMQNSTNIAILSQTMGIAHNQRHMETYSRGILGSVTLCGRDITLGSWEMEPGLEGELLKGGDPPVDPRQYENNKLLDMPWKRYDPSQHKLQMQQQKAEPGAQINWYAIELDNMLINTQDSTQDEEEMLYAVDLASMTKGQLWINGHHLGRYWLRRAPRKEHHEPCQKCVYNNWYSPDNMCRQHCGEITQRYYHLPRSYLNLPSANYRNLKLSGFNTLYVLEELDGHPEHISIARRVSPFPKDKDDEDDGHDSPSPPPPGRPRYGIWSWLLIVGIIVCSAAAAVGLGTVLFSAFDRWRTRRGYLPLENGNSTD
ncbi:hypothetical protein COEREDRAFT_82488 [Coemansia reversa NRRL 1564]|uniref:Beta-galactosidase n=1 Tax=Coemansia reversa (strain ATCC 12441 / NRRL 1564) TaxID=763665 RepID=A0A2G5B6U9_COERN|nr:hypothetical protein COEREDRAFT_82488 [Coemansia reversa NRRL 1564]|eukprot:PIA14730.1 hypothetical protein COEREDRAFT_82488 [Coemansia reversa NRRL 1564]